MLGALTRDEAAELFGVSVLSLDAMGIVLGGALHEAEGAPEEQRVDGEPWELTRRELAALWSVHEDTLSKWLPDGLGAAVVDRRERGELVFDVRLALRWRLARDGALNHHVLEDFRVCAARGVPALHVLSALSAINRMLAPAVPEHEPKRRRATTRTKATRRTR